MKRYAIAIERAGRNYSAYVPDLSGCVATGKTVEATERLLREAIELHLAGLREDSLDVPEPSCVVDYVDISACVVFKVPESIFQQNRPFNLFPAWRWTLSKNLNKRIMLIGSMA
jgi:predicted RNase H-like HicB family nuclease